MKTFLDHIINYACLGCLIRDGTVAACDDDVTKIDENSMFFYETGVVHDKQTAPTLKFLSVFMQLMYTYHLRTTCTLYLVTIIHIRYIIRTDIMSDCNSNESSSY